MRIKAGVISLVIVVLVALSTVAWGFNALTFEDSDCDKALNKSLSDTRAIVCALAQLTEAIRQQNEILSEILTHLKDTQDPNKQLQALEEFLK